MGQDVLSFEPPRVLAIKPKPCLGLSNFPLELIVPNLGLVIGLLKCILSSLVKPGETP